MVSASRSCGLVERPAIAGVTLLEMMVVLTILGILTAVAVPSYSYLVASNAARTASTELHLALLQARSEAVKRNRVVTLAPVNSQWTNGWIAQDADGNTLVQRGALKGVTVSGAPANVAYLSTGRMRGGASQSFEVASASDTDLKRCVQIDLNGRPFVKDSAC